MVDNIGVVDKIVNEFGVCDGRLDEFVVAAAGFGGPLGGVSVVPIDDKVVL